jgi:hypothetical protein
MYANTIVPFPPEPIFFDVLSRGSYRGSPIRDTYSRPHSHNASLPMTREQDLKQRRELEAYTLKLVEEFKIVDTNSDGLLTYSEVENFLIKKVNLNHFKQRCVLYIGIRTTRKRRSDSLDILNVRQR